MADIFSRKKRGEIMRAVKSDCTSPELIVRAIVQEFGFRCRYNVRQITGCPDVSIGRLKKVIFVHGCFWHRHRCRKGRSTPTTRAAFWQNKFEANKRRDGVVRRKLRREGWRVLVVWECQTTPQKRESLRRRIAAFLA